MDHVLLFLAVTAISVASVFAWIKLNKKIVGIDINKPRKPKVAESAGISLLVPFWIGIGTVFLFTGTIFIELLAVGMLGSALAIIGFADDSKLKWKGSKVMAWKTRAFFIATACLAFAWFFAPHPVWVVPIALYIAGLASLQNTFAGLNGWTGGSALIVSLAAAAIFFVPFSQGIVFGGLLEFSASIILAGCILGFLVWNHFPARCLEGDSGTLFMGGTTAGIFLMTGRIELMAFSLLFYAPNMIDFFGLKMITNRKDMSQQKLPPYEVMGDGKLGIPDYGDGKKSSISLNWF